MKQKLYYKKIYNGYLVCNKSLGTHTHINNKYTCKTLIKLLKRREMPKSPYLRESAMRLLPLGEYEKLVEKKMKPYYININKGVR